jgi:hypothetical protein
MSLGDVAALSRAPQIVHQALLRVHKDLSLDKVATTFAHRMTTKHRLALVVAVQPMLILMEMASLTAQTSAHRIQVRFCQADVDALKQQALTI